MSEEVVLTTFQSLRRRLNRLASGWLHNDDDASDVLQEAFVRLWTSYRHVDEPREVLKTGDREIFEALQKKAPENRP